MSHHSSDHDMPADLMCKIAEEFNIPKAGPTFKFPDGKLTPHDEGEIAIAVAELNGRLVMNFGKPIQSIGFTRQEALALRDRFTAYLGKVD